MASGRLRVLAVEIQLLSASDARKFDEAFSARVTYDASELLVPELELNLQQIKKRQSLHHANADITKIPLTNYATVQGICPVDPNYLLQCCYYWLSCSYCYYSCQLNLYYCLHRSIVVAADLLHR